MKPEKNVVYVTNIVVFRFDFTNLDTYTLQVLSFKVYFRPGHAIARVTLAFMCICHVW